MNLALSILIIALENPKLRFYKLQDLQIKIHETEHQFKTDGNYK